jgi:Flp pilus assembly pilin Flp
MTQWGTNLATGKQAGQAVLEYAILLAAILLLVFGTVRVIGANAGTVFSHAASSLIGSDSE